MSFNVAKLFLQAKFSIVLALTESHRKVGFDDEFSDFSCDLGEKVQKIRDLKLYV